MTSNVEALFKYSYEYDGKTISFQKGETFALVKKVNGDWWQVKRKHDNGVLESIYVPANYMKEVEDESVKSHTYQNMSDFQKEYEKAKEGMKKQPATSTTAASGGPPPTQPKVRVSPKLARMKSLDTSINAQSKTNGGIPCPQIKSGGVVSGSNVSQSVPSRTATEPEYAIPTPPPSTFTKPEEDQQPVKPIVKEWQMGYSLPQHVKKGGGDTVESSLDSGVRNGSSATPSPTVSHTPNQDVFQKNAQFQSMLNSQLGGSNSRPMSTMNISNVPNLSSSAGSYQLKAVPVPTKPKPKHNSLPRPKSFCVEDEVPTTPSTFAGPSAGMGGGNKLPQSIVESFNKRGIGKKEDAGEDLKPPLSSPGISTPATPISPSMLPEGWSEHKTAEGKVYYYNCITKESKWTRPVGDPPNPPPPLPPPEELPTTQSPAEGGSPKTSPTKKTSTTSSSLDVHSIAPRGWTKEINPLTQTPVFTNSRTHEKWALANDESGYFYYLLSNSSVRLQNLPPIMDDTSEAMYDHLTTNASSSSGSKKSTSKLPGGTVMDHEYAEPELPSYIKQQSNPSSFSSSIESSNASIHSSQQLDLWSTAMTTTFLRKHGYLQRKRVIDSNNKKLRSEKWVKLFVSLQANQLMFYSDHRTKDQPGAKPVSSFSLLHSNISLMNYKDKKKQVIQISSSTGEQFCLEAENPTQMNDWYSTIQTAIVQTNEDYKMNPTKYSSVLSGNSGMSETSPPTQSKFPHRKSNSLMRGMDFDDIEEIEQLSGAEKTVRIKGRLRNLIARRPQADTLKKHGIMQEPIFGSPIDVLASREHRAVPLFLENLVSHIEKKGLKVVGIYRLSGNASQVQKLRYLMEENPRADLSGPDWSDINVVTGCLKLYFRELPDPLIPFKFYKSIINTTTLPADKRPQAIASEISKFPEPNYRTLKFLIKHLAKVVEHGHVNKMLANNLGIVFGPTLMRSEVDSLEIASMMPLQNNVIETIITEEAQIFRK